MIFGFDMQLPFEEIEGVKYVADREGSAILFCLTCGAEYFKGPKYGLTHCLLSHGELSHLPLDAYDRHLSLWRRLGSRRPAGIGRFDCVRSDLSPGAPSAARASVGPSKATPSAARERKGLVRLDTGGR